MLEVNRRLYMDEESAEKLAGCWTAFALAMLHGDTFNRLAASVRLVSKLSTTKLGHYQLSI